MLKQNSLRKTAAAALRCALRSLQRERRWLAKTTKRAHAGAISAAMIVVSIFLSLDFVSLRHRTTLNKGTHTQVAPKLSFFDGSR